MYKEIGGYIELDSYRGGMLYEEAVKLNCGRCALEYLIKAKGIKRILIPKFMCSSNDAVFRKLDVECHYYSIDMYFHPIIERRAGDEWIYLVNYYGQLSNDYICSLGKRVIVDNTQAYFQEPIAGYDTIYSCRKYFGVADGAILFTDKQLCGLEQDKSFDNMYFLLGRYENTATEFYEEYKKNDTRFATEPLKKMSKLTENLLHAIDYEFVKSQRTKNFMCLHNSFMEMNKLELCIPSGAFMYPLYISNGAHIREYLKEKKIYIPILWPDVFKVCRKEDLEYDMAINILPIPVDQRYDIDDMMFIVKEVKECIG